LSALKVEEVRRVLSYSTAGQIALVLSALGAGAETAALFLLVLHGAAKALARSAVNSLALVAGEEWHRDRLGRLRAYVPVSSAAFALALVLLGLAPGLAGLWLWNELQTVWLQSLWFGAAFLSALQHFALLLRFFTALKVKQAQAFCALTPASRVALCALGVLALGVALAVPLSPANWMFWLPAAAALAPALFAPLGATLLGALLAWIVFSSAGRGQGGKIATSAHSTLLAEGFYLPRFYDVAVAQPLMRVATWWRDIDTALVELGLLGGGALLVRGLGFVLLAAQNGRVRTYATVVLVGVVAVLLIMLPR
jgi:NADH-quinone oxidoreductase subunit L